MDFSAIVFGHFTCLLYGSPIPDVVYFRESLASEPVRVAVACIPKFYGI